MLFHLSALALIWYGFGFYAALRASIIPVFFIFPIAFTLNRLGQHYDIDPTDPAKWGTLMRGHWFWDFAFLNSNYHLEHHYFPGVPFYRSILTPDRAAPSPCAECLPPPLPSRGSAAGGTARSGCRTRAP
jgi:fatty acid desaturase